jgi:hypothetical protein
MLDGTMAGMVTGSQLQEELARKKETDRKRIAALDSSVTGRYAKTVGILKQSCLLHTAGAGWLAAGCSRACHPADAMHLPPGHGL